MKKAYVRTLEAGIAAFITFLFITMVLPKYAPLTEKAYDPMMNSYEGNPDFRNCAIDYNVSCLQSIFRISVPQSMELIVDISENPNTIRANLPTKRINTDSLFIQGNSTDYAPRMVKIYDYKR